MYKEPILVVTTVGDYNIWGRWRPHGCNAFCFDIRQTEILIDTIIIASHGGFCVLFLFVWTPSKDFYSCLSLFEFSLCVFKIKTYFHIEHPNIDHWFSCHYEEKAQIDRIFIDFLIKAQQADTGHNGDNRFLLTESSALNFHITLKGKVANETIIIFKKRLTEEVFEFYVITISQCFSNA